MKLLAVVVVALVMLLVAAATIVLAAHDIRRWRQVEAKARWTVETRHTSDTTTKVDIVLVARRDRRVRRLGRESIAATRLSPSGADYSLWLYNSVSAATQEAELLNVRRALRDDDA